MHCSFVFLASVLLARMLNGLAQALLFRRKYSLCVNVGIELYWTLFVIVRQLALSFQRIVRMPMSIQRCNYVFYAYAARNPKYCREGKMAWNPIPHAILNAAKTLRRLKDTSANCSMKRRKAKANRVNSASTQTTQTSLLHNQQHKYKQLVF